MARYRGICLTLMAAAGAALASGPAGAAQSASFDAYIARGYGEIADFAATKVENPVLAAHFKRRAAQAAAGRQLQPEGLASWHLDDWTAHEADAARRQLIDRLNAGARQRQPLLAAIAQVNFDCWVAPFPVRAGLRGSSDCRRKFYIAFAQLAPAPARPNTSIIAQPASATGEIAFVPRLKPVLPPSPAAPIPGQQIAAAPTGDPMPDASGPATCAADGADGACQSPVGAGIGYADPLAGLLDPGHDGGSTTADGPATPSRAAGHSTTNNNPSGSGDGEGDSGGGLGGMLGGALGAVGGAIGGGDGSGGHGHGHGHGHDGGG
jgi:hypothetical protein